MGGASRQKRRILKISSSWHTLQYSLSRFLFEAYSVFRPTLHKTCMVRGAWARRCGTQFSLQFALSTNGIRGKEAKGAHPISLILMCPQSWKLWSSPTHQGFYLHLGWRSSKEREYLPGLATLHLSRGKLLGTRSQALDPVCLLLREEGAASSQMWLKFGVHAREKWQGMLESYGRDRSQLPQWTHSGGIVDIFGPCARVSAMLLLSVWRCPVQLAPLFWADCNLHEA